MRLALAAMRARHYPISVKLPAAKVGASHGKDLI
jgi:hypothetical protein